MMSDAHCCVLAACLLFSLRGDVTGVSETTCSPRSCGVDSATYLLGTRTCQTVVFPHEPKEYIGDRCGGDQPFQCYRAQNRYNNITGMQGRLRLDLEHKLSTGRLTHLTFSTSYQSGQGVKGHLVVVEAISKTSVEVVAAVEVTCEDIVPMWVDHCVRLPEEVKINAETSDFYLGYISRDDDISQQAYNWYYVKKSATVGTYVTDRLFKTVAPGDVLRLYPATQLPGWPSPQLLLYVNARIQKAGCTCDSMCEPGGKCAPFEEDCTCNPGYRPVTRNNRKVCEECPDGFFGAGCSFRCPCEEASTKACAKHDGKCVCMPGYQGDRCELNSFFCRGCDPATTICVSLDFEWECLCPAGQYDISRSTGRTTGRKAREYHVQKQPVVCTACREGSWGIKCEGSCACHATGSYNPWQCDAVTGKCSCRPGWAGQRCNQDVNECVSDGSQALCRRAGERCQNKMGSYECACKPNFVRLTDSADCQEFTADVILDPAAPTLDRPTALYLVLGVPSDYQTSIAFDIEVGELSCTATVWDGMTQGPGQDATTWAERPFEWDGSLEKVSWPQAVMRVSWAFAGSPTRVRVTSSSEHIPPVDRQVSFQLRDSEDIGFAQCLDTIGLQNTSPRWAAVTQVFHRNDKVRVVLTVNTPNTCPQDYSFANSRWALYVMPPSAPSSCFDFLGLQQLQVTAETTDDQLLIPASHLPLGITSVCSTFTFVHDTHGMQRILKCGYLKVKLTGQVVVKLQPFTEEPIVAPAGSSVHFDARESFCLDRDNTVPPTPGEYTYDWHCNLDEDGVIKAACDGTYPVMGDEKGKLVINTGQPEFKAGKTYRITVIVKWGSLTGEGYRTISVTNAPRLPVQIRCVHNCFKSARADDYVKLDGILDDGMTSGHDVRSEWRVTTADKTWSGSDMALISAGTSNTLSLDVLPNVFQPGGSYNFTLEASSATANLRTQVSHVVRFGASPQGGTCVVYPSSGSSMVTKFSVNCKDWVDANPPLMYKIYLRPVSQRGEGVLVASSFRDTMEDLVFPVGKFDSNSSLSYKCIAHMQIVNTEDFATSVDQIVTVYPMAYTQRHPGSLARTFAQMFTSDEGTESTETRNSYALSLALYLNSEATALPDAASRSERKQMREDVLGLYARHMMISKAETEQLSAILELLSAREEEITDTAEEYLLDIIEEVSQALAVNSMTENSKEELARQQLVVMDRLTRRMVQKASFHGVHENSTLSQKYSEISTRFSKVLENIGSGLLKVTSRANTSKSVELGTMAVSVMWVPSGFAGDMHTTARLAKAEVDVFIQPQSLPQSLQESDLQLTMAATTTNFYKWAQGSDNLTLPLVIVSLQDRMTKQRQEVRATTQPILIFLEAKQEEKNGWKSLRFFLDGPEERVVVGAFRDRGTLVDLRVTPSSLRVAVSVGLARGNDSSITVFSESTWPQAGAKVLRHLTHAPSTFLLPARNDVRQGDRYVIVVRDIDATAANETTTHSLAVVRLLMGEVSCLTWNSSAWRHDSCTVSPASTFDAIVCECSHLSVFSGSLQMAFNVLNLQDLRLLGQFFYNPIMVTAVVLVWAIYLALLYWAHHADYLDKAACGFGVLEDNIIDDNFHYKVCVVTGWWRNAGTTSKVYIYLNGEMSKSRVHLLADPDRDVFHSGAENWFLLTTPDSLGNLSSIVIWHSNSGPRPDWFLQEVYVEDGASGQGWWCLYNDWLRVGSGRLCVEVPALSEEVRARQRMYQFVSTTNRSLRTENIWLSILTKPTHSTFTRKQRLTCALCALLSMMLAVLLFHGIPTDNPVDDILTGPVTINVKSVLIGIETSIIVVPISILLIEMFTRIARPTSKATLPSPGNPRDEEGGRAGDVLVLNSVIAKKKSRLEYASDDDGCEDEEYNDNCTMRHEAHVCIEREGGRSPDAGDDGEVYGNDPDDGRFCSRPYCRHQSASSGDQFPWNGNDNLQHAATRAPDLQHGATSCGGQQHGRQDGGGETYRGRNKNGHGTDSRLHQDRQKIAGSTGDSTRSSDCEHSYYDSDLQSRGDSPRQQTRCFPGDYDVRRGKASCSELTCNFPASGFLRKRRQVRRQHPDFLESMSSEGKVEHTEDWNTDHSMFRTDAKAPPDCCLGNRLQWVFEETGRQRQRQKKFQRQVVQRLAEMEVDANRNAIDFDGLGWDTSRVRSVHSTEEISPCQQPGRLMMPWWGLYVAWGVTLSLAAILSLLVMLYGLKIGHQASVNVLVSFLVAFTGSAMCLEVLKAVAVSVLVVFIFQKSADPRDEDLFAGHDSNSISAHIKSTLIQLQRQRDLLKGHWRQTEYHYPISKSKVKDIQVRLRQDVLAQNLLREILMYVAFVTACLVAFLGHTQLHDKYLANTVTRNIISNPGRRGDKITLSQVHTEKDVWTYLDTSLLLTLMNTVEQTTASGESYLLGLARLRQVRQVAKPDICRTGTKYSQHLRLWHMCLDHFSLDMAEIRDFLPSWKTLADSANQKSSTWGAAQLKAWRYHSETSLGEARLTGVFGTYPGGGYVVDLPRRVEEARETLSELRAADWLDSGTRALIVTCTLYCANRDLATEVTLLWEMGPLGRVWSWLWVHTSRLHYYNSNFEEYVAIAEGAVLLMTLMYARYELQLASRLGLRLYLSSFWNWLELAIQVLILMTLVVHVYRLVLLWSFEAALRSARNTLHVSFAAVRASEEVLKSVKGVLFALIILKALRLMQYNRRMRVLLTTFSIARGSVLCCTLLTALLLAAFTSFSHVLFGAELEAYSSWVDAFVQLLAFALGRTHFLRIEPACQTVGSLLLSLLFFLFTAAAVLLLTVIILEAYAVARVYVYLNNDDFYFIEHIRRWFHLLMGTTPTMTRVRRRKRPRFQKRRAPCNQSAPSCDVTRKSRHLPVTSPNPWTSAPPCDVTAARSHLSVTGTSVDSTLRHHSNGDTAL